MLFFFSFNGLDLHVRRISGNRRSRERPPDGSYPCHRVRPSRYGNQEQGRQKYFQVNICFPVSNQVLRAFKLKVLNSAES